MALIAGFGILQDQRVTVWYTAPTAIRMLMKVASRDDPGMVADYDLSRLRFLASVGEPLNPEGVVWGRDVLGLPFHDNWWQTETGGIMIANYRCMDIKPGSMGKPLPGVAAAAIGIPEPTAGEIVKALVALKPGFAPSEDLRRDLLAHARKRLGPAVAPRSIDFRANLPKTRSGKIMRRLLRARELGLPEGDISTLESDER